MEATIVQSWSTNGHIKDRLRQIVKEHAGLNLPLESIEDSTDLYRAGMSSQGSVILMIALEGHFGVEFPDAMLSRDTFVNIDSIANAIETARRAEQ